MILFNALFLAKLFFRTLFCFLRTSYIDLLRGFTGVYNDCCTVVDDLRKPGSRNTVDRVSVFL